MQIAIDLPAMQPAAIGVHGFFFFVSTMEIGLVPIIDLIDQALSLALSPLPAANKNDFRGAAHCLESGHLIVINKL